MSKDSLWVRLRRARSWLLCRLGLHKWVRGGELVSTISHSRYVSTRVCQRCYREEALCRGAGSDDWIETRGK